MPRTPLPRRAFMHADPGEDLEGARRLPLDLVDPNPQQSRQVFDEGRLTELAQSIAAHGVLEPILVRPVGDRYQVVAGERRTRAARQAGLTDIPVLIRVMSDEAAAYATAVENLQREDLDPEDEARWFAYLQELTSLSQRELARQLGVDHSYLSERVRMLARPDLLSAYRAGTLTWKQALAALSQPAVYAAHTETMAPSYNHPSAPPVYAAHTETITPSYIPPPAPAPRPVERAALDQADGSGDTRRIPYRARALDSAATTFLRTDWSSVPAGERATVAAQLEMIAEAARTALDALKK